MSSRFITGLTLSLVAAAVGAACSDDSNNNNPPPPSADVSITANAPTKTFTAFDPDTFTVALNGGASVAVRWRNDDNTIHTVTDTTTVPVFNTNNIAVGDTASIVFTTAGTYGYHCSIHPTMVGTVVVNP